MINSDSRLCECVASWVCGELVGGELDGGGLDGGEMYGTPIVYD